MATLPNSRLAESVAAPMPDVESVALPELMVKSVGSISHIPELPDLALVVTLTSAAMLTAGAEVSIWPPLPPFGADASSFPPTFIDPLPRRKMRPFLDSTVRACRTPSLLTAEFRACSAPFAVRMMLPPSAMIACLFSTKASRYPRVTLTSIGIPLPSVSSICSPATSAVEPSRVEIVPWLLTRVEASTTYPPDADSMEPKFRTEPRPGAERLKFSPITPSASRWVVARNPAVSIRPVLPMTMPFGLLTKT